MKDIMLPPKAMFLLTGKSRYKVLYGGRGSAKTFSIALSLIILSLQRKIRVLCARQIQASIADSVHKTLCDAIDLIGVQSFFRINENSIRSVNGSEFIFQGIKNNPSEIKSLQGINYCWVEEAENVSEESWEILTPTIREEGSEIWISFNPRMKSDPTYQRFVAKPPRDCISVKMNFSDNPFFPEVLRREMEECKALNEAKYRHIWLGEPNSEAGNLIKLEWFKRFDNPPSLYASMFIVADTAFSEKKSADNSAFGLFGIDFESHAWLLDGYCRKVIFPDLMRDLKSFYLKAVSEWGAMNSISAIFIENKGSGISLIQQLRQEGLPISELQPTYFNAALKKEQVADKYTRFLEVSADIESGYVHIPNQASWLPEFVNQCEAFTGGKQDAHDDFVDVLIYGMKQRRKSIAPDWAKAKRAFM